MDTLYIYLAVTILGAIVVTFIKVGQYYESKKPPQK